MLNKFKGLIVSFKELMTSKCTHSISNSHISKKHNVSSEENAVATTPVHNDDYSSCLHSNYKFISSHDVFDLSNQNNKYENSSKNLSQYPFMTEFEKEMKNFISTLPNRDKMFFFDLLEEKEREKIQPYINECMEQIKEEGKKIKKLYKRKNDISILNRALLFGVDDENVKKEIEKVKLEMEMHMKKYA